MAKEKQEYDYEGDMAMSQLKSIIANAQRIHDMLERDTNIPEWVQSKITLAEDYITTASNYLQGEMSEDVVRVGTLAQRTQAYRADKARKAGANLKMDPDTGTPDHFTAAMRRKKGLPEEAEQISELSRTLVKSYLIKKTAKLKDGDGKDYPTSTSFRKSMEAPGVARAKLGKTSKRRPNTDVKIKATNEEVAHSVHVKTYDSHGEKQMNSPEFKKHIEAHGGKLDYVSDKGAAFKFASHSHAAAFHRGIQSKFKELDSEHDMNEDMAMGTGPVNVAANVADPKNKKLFAKPMKRFKNFKAE